MLIYKLFLGNIKNLHQLTAAAHHHEMPQMNPTKPRKSLQPF